MTVDDAEDLFTIFDVDGRGAVPTGRAAPQSSRVPMVEPDSGGCSACGRSRRVQDSVPAASPGLAGM